jgi:hypothetical protein
MGIIMHHKIKKKDKNFGATYCIRLVWGQVTSASRNLYPKDGKAFSSKIFVPIYQ